MHPLYIKSISTLPILFVLFPPSILLGKCLSPAMLTTFKTCTGIKLYVCLDKQIGPKVQGILLYSFPSGDCFSVKRKNLKLQLLLVLVCEIDV